MAATTLVMAALVALGLYSFFGLLRQERARADVRRGESPPSEEG